MLFSVQEKVDMVNTAYAA